MTARRNRRALALLAPAVALVTLGACSNSSGGGGNNAAGPVPTLSGSCAQFQAYAGHSGTTVTMNGSILSPESDSLQQSWKEFSDCTGIAVKYSGSNDFESQLPVKVAGGNAPDLAIVPQPGLLQKMVQTGKVKKPPAQTETNEAKWNKAWKDYGSVNGTFYAAPMSANLKSLVWYSPKMFKQAGYTIPTTWADLMSLSDKIAASGSVKPWCGGIGSGTATGWPATDWLEELVLRQAGGDTYDKWVSHDVKFSDAPIMQALQTLQGWMLNPKYVNGGFGDVKTIATTTFQAAGTPILKGKCFMLQQASFYEAQWPKGTKVGEDGDVMAFYLPGISSSVTTPVEGGGEFVTAFSDRPEVQAVQNYLSTAEWATSRIKVAPGWVSANSGVDQTVYTDPIDKLSAKYLTDPNATFRFDASDLMPAAVGAGSEWHEFTALFGSGKSIQNVAKAIDASWPS
jgi:alpha-glucoside transport system substrate-binding protein